MKTNMNSNRIETNNENAFTKFCLDYCRKLLAEIQEARNRLVGQFRKAFAGQEQLLRLALNEAEALAFLTDYPHLVFPSLAMEKVQGAVEWRAQQQKLGREPARASRF
jgi:hypothetical protein